MQPNISEKLSQPINNLVRSICSIISEEYGIPNEESFNKVINELQISVVMKSKKDTITSPLFNLNSIEEVRKVSVNILKQFCKDNNSRTNGDKALLVKRAWSIINPNFTLNEPPPAKRGRKSNKEKKDSLHHILNDSGPSTPGNEQDNEQDNDHEIFEIDGLGSCKRVNIRDNCIISYNTGNYYLEILTNEIFEETGDSLEYTGKMVDGVLNNTIESSHC